MSSVIVLGLTVAAGCDIEEVDTAGATEGDSGSESETSGSSGGVSESGGSTSSTSGQDSDSDSSGSSSATTTTDGGDSGSANDRCNTFCEGFVGVPCDSDLTVEGCLLTCQALTSADNCNDSGNAYFDCVDGTTIECNAQGDRYALGCGIQWVAAIGCAVTEDPNPTIVEPCQEHCGNIAAQACGANEPEEDCNISCRWFGATGTGCDDEWLGYVECANAAEWSCLLGFAVPAMCGEPYAAYWECINNPS